MRTASFPENYYMDVEDLIDNVDGNEFRPHAPNSEQHWKCDWCSTGVPYQKEPRVANYLADWVCDNTTESGKRVNSSRKLTTLATYCESCSEPRLLFPSTKATEVRVMFTVTESKTISDVEVTDISPQGEGIPWNPRELAEKITEAPYQTLARLSGNSTVMGPENIVTYFLALGTGVDIREIVDWEGNIDPKALGKARKKLNEVKEQRVSESRREYRDRVRRQ